MLDFHSIALGCDINLEATSYVLVWIYRHGSMGSFPSVYVSVSGYELNVYNKGYYFTSFPTLNGISVFCLASVHASPKTRAVFTNIFGGASGNEGLGIGSISLDWQYIGSSYLAFVLSLHLPVVHATI